MKLFLNKLIYLKNNKSFSNVKQLANKTKNLDLYEYFKLSPEDRKNYLIKK